MKVNLLVLIKTNFSRMGSGLKKIFRRKGAVKSQNMNPHWCLFLRPSVDWTRGYKRKIYFWFGVIVAVLLVLFVCSLTILRPGPKIVEVPVEVPKEVIKEVIKEVPGKTEIKIVNDPGVLKQLSILQSEKEGWLKEKAELNDRLAGLQIANQKLAAEKEALAVQIQPYPAPPKIVRNIKYDEVMAMLRTYFPGSITRGVVDLEYKLTTLAEIKRFLAEDKTNESIFINPFYDNDDFAFRLLGQFSHLSEWATIPSGWVKTPESMYNIVIAVGEDNKAHLYGINAETDKVWEITAPETIIYVVI